MKQEIVTLGKGKKGEFRARRAGMILDVTSDGYYNTELCSPDFVKVDILFMPANKCKTIIPNIMILLYF